MYRYTTLCLSIYLWMDTGCLQLLVIVNNAVNKNCHTSICLSPCFPSFGYIPSSEIASPCGNSMFSFSEEAEPFCKVAAPFYVLISNV